MIFGIEECSYVDNHASAGEKIVKKEKFFFNRILQFIFAFLTDWEHSFNEKNNFLKSRLEY